MYALTSNAATNSMSEGSMPPDVIGGQTYPVVVRLAVSDFRGNTACLARERSAIAHAGYGNLDLSTHDCLGFESA